MSAETPLPTVSVVVPTYRRRDNLTEVVLPLLEDPALLELLVVVDGCDDGSLELLEQIAASHPRLRPVWTENSGGAAARQTGIDAAVGDVVLLLDDDVVAAPGLVSGHARRHQEHDDLVVLGYMPTRPPEPGARGRFATHLYAQEYESVAVDGAQTVDREGTRATYQFERNSITASELIGRLSAHYRIRDLQVRESEIEEIVRRIYEERLLET